MPRHARLGHGPLGCADDLSVRALADHVVPSEAYHAVPSEAYPAGPSEAYHVVPSEAYHVVPSEAYHVVPSEAYRSSRLQSTRRLSLSCADDLTYNLAVGRLAKCGGDVVCSYVLPGGRHVCCAL
jgi:hypothetical protein